MKPCSSCPWSKTSTLGFWHPAHLISTAYALSGDIPMGNMGCHQWNGNYHSSRQPKDSPPCGGWIRVAEDSVAVRLLIALGKVDYEETIDDAGSLFKDVQTMLRYNGIDVDRLPSLKPPFPVTVEEHRAWLKALVDLKSMMSEDPESAWEYVMPGSPLEYGLDQDGIPIMPRDLMEAWLKKCLQWSKARDRAGTEVGDGS